VKELKNESDQEKNDQREERRKTRLGEEKGRRKHDFYTTRSMQLSTSIRRSFKHGKASHTTL
jgi:hypothetical protein